MGRFFGIGTLAALAGLAIAAPGSAHDAAHPSAVTIDWDQWGVPHIEAASAEGASYALGWAMARGRPDQLLELMGQGRGRAAELWGEDYFAGDALMWRFGIPQAIDALYDAQGADYQARLEAFAGGVNAYAAAHPEAIDDVRERVLPVTGRDVIGHAQRTLNLIFMAGGELQGLERRLAEATPRPGQVEDDGNGSNGWAIAPSRSESGHALLLINPHLPWDGVFTWFEAHLRSPGLNAYGAALLGQPFTSIMFNEHLGWTHTVNDRDAVDVYALPLADGGYRFGGEVRAFDDSAVVLRVRGEDGTISERRLPIRRSVHGPVLAVRGGTAYAMRVAGVADPAYAATFAQYGDMAAATGRAEWEAAFSRLQLPMFNAVFADDSGDILYVSNGLHPARPRGDADFWAGVVDGSDPSLLWTGYLPYERLLRVADPASGFVQNSNEPGFTATMPPALDPADFPADFVSPYMRTRPQHGLEILLGDGSISFDELIDYSRDTRLTLADNVLDDLIAAARADSRDQALRAADVLARWDRRSNVESRGAALFSLWTFAYAASPGGFEYDRPWSFDAPMAWPEGIGNEAAAVEALVATAGRIEGAGAPIDVAWGAVAQVPDGEGATMPSSLGIGGAGAFRVGFFSPREDALTFAFNGGTSYVAAVEFGDTVRAEAILPYGNFAVRPEGVMSQYPLFARGEYRTVNFTPEAIEAATVMREELAFPGE